MQAYDHAAKNAVATNKKLEIVDKAPANCNTKSTLTKANNQLRPAKINAANAHQPAINCHVIVLELFLPFYFLLIYIFQHILTLFQLIYNKKIFRN